MTLIMSKRVDLVYPELSYDISGIGFEVHNKLSRFCREKQYADEFENSLKLAKISYIRECDLSNFGQELNGNIVDFLIENKILVDLKAKKFITKDDYYQMLRYLKCSGMKLGLIINFRNTYLKPKRIINITD